MIFDYYENPIDIGDTVTFPAGEGFMDGVVEKIRENKKNSKWNEIFVLNTSGYKKWKKSINVINKMVEKC